MASQFDLNVRTLTWNHDSRGLFDYESKNVYKRMYRARPSNESYTINRSGSEVGVVLNPTLPPSVPSFFQHPSGDSGTVSPLRLPSESESRTDSKPLIRVFYESGRYWIEHPERSRDPSKTLWVVIKQTKYPCVINAGDMIKMGRFKIRVREAVADVDAPLSERTKGKRFSVASTDSYDAETYASDDDQALGGDDQFEDEKTRPSHPLQEVQSVEVCRICYDSGEESNPLIAPCKCSGSMQYVHLSCLRKWMDGRLSVNTQAPSRDGTTTVSYFWRNLDCELCKQAYPTTVERPRRQSVTGVEMVDLYELPKPTTPYVVLESNIRMPTPAGSAASPQITFQKGLHIMSLSKSRPSVLVGRGHDADVRINDISVSRVHGVLRLVQGTVNGVKKQQIVLEDKQSKFGSLIAVKGPIPLEPGVPVSIQSGRTVTTISIKKPNILSNIIPICFGKSLLSSGSTGGSMNAIFGQGCAAANPILVSESNPPVDLKQVLNSSMTSSNGLANAAAEAAGADLIQPNQRASGLRGSVASTALRRASEALSALQQEEEEEERVRRAGNEDDSVQHAY